MTTEQQTSEPTPAQMLIRSVIEKQATAIPVAVESTIESPPAEQVEVSPEPADLREVLGLTSPEEQEMLRRLTVQFYKVDGEPTSRHMADCVGNLIRDMYTRQGMPSVHPVEKPVAKPKAVPVESDYIATEKIVFYLNGQITIAKDQVLKWPRDAHVIRFCVENSMPVIVLTETAIDAWKQHEADLWKLKGGVDPSKPKQNAIAELHSQL